MSEENITKTIPKYYDPTNYDPKIYDESLIKKLCKLVDPSPIKEDEKIKFKFANNKKAIEYNFKSAESNDFTLGISDTSQWTFAPKQHERQLLYNFK